MALNLYVQNFRKLRNVSLEDDGNFSIIIGHNEAGKSSLAGSIQYAFTGSAYGQKGKDVANLVRHGETRMKVDVQVGPISISRTRSSGLALKEVADMLKVDTAILPLLFNSRLCLNASGRTMKAFLEAMAAAPLDLDAELKDEPDMLEMLGKARQASNVTIKQIESYAVAQRAASQEPAAPIAPAGEKPWDAAPVSEEEITTLSVDQAQKSAKSKELAADNELLDRCSRYLAAHTKYREKLRKASSDKIADKRDALSALAGADVEPLTTLSARLEAAGHKKAAQKLEAAAKEALTFIAEAQATLQANPPPESVGVEPTLSEVTGARYAKLAEKTPEHIAELIAANNTTIATLNSEVAALDTQIREKREALRAHAESKAAWAAYEKALEQHPAQCETVKSVWNAWNKLAHRIADLQSNRQNETASKFLGVVSSLASSVLGGRPLTFSEDGEILLDGLSIELLSDSTQWRVAACVMAAIALHANSPLLILDGADILDDRNRTSLLQFILSEIAPKFQHTILLATVRGNLADEKPFPGAATKYIMNEGQLFKCMAGGQTWIAQQAA